MRFEVEGIPKDGSGIESCKFLYFLESGGRRDVDFCESGPDDVDSGDENIILYEEGLDFLTKRAFLS